MKLVDKSLDYCMNAERCFETAKNVWGEVRVQTDHYRHDQEFGDQRGEKAAENYLQLPGFTEFTDEEKIRKMWAERADCWVVISHEGGS